MHIKSLKKPLKISILCVALCFFIAITNPNHIPSVLLIVPFLLLALILYQLVKAGFGFANNAQKAEDAKPSVLRPRLMACLAAGFPVLLLLLQSIGQLSIKDVITVAAIFIIAYFYIGKVSSQPVAR